MCGRNHHQHDIQLGAEVAGAPAMPCFSQFIVHSTTFGTHMRPFALRKTHDCTFSLSANGAVLAGMGHVAAAACIGELVGKPLMPSTPRMPRSQRDDMWKALARREQEVFGLAKPTQLLPEDIESIVNDMWGRRCPHTGACIGGSETLVSLTTYCPVVHSSTA